MKTTRALTILFAIVAGGTACVGSSPDEQPATIVRQSALVTCAPRIPIASPPESAGHGLAFDAGRGVLLLFGDAIGPGSSNATLYEMDTASRSWFRVAAAAPMPTARFLPTFVFDESTGRTVLFSGRTDDPLPRDVWEWDGCGWLDRTPASLPAGWPSGRWGAASTYDPASGRVIVTTGIEAVDTPWESAVADATVYEWNSTGGTFVARAPAGDPPASRGGAVAVGDAARGLVYLTGGFRATDSFNGPGDMAVYVWNGTTRQWAQRTPTPAPIERAFASAIFDPVADHVLLWGGLWYGWERRFDAWRYAPGTDTFTFAAQDEVLNRFWSPAAYDATNGLAIQYGGSAAYQQDSFAGISQWPFSGFSNPFYVKQTGDTRHVTASGGVSLLLEAPGTTFSAYLTAPVTLDGVISPGEWDDAAVQAFSFCNGRRPALVYLKNDATDLYMAMVLDYAVWDPTATFYIQFDDDGDRAFSTGDNQWQVKPHVDDMEVIDASRANIGLGYVYDTVEANGEAAGTTDVVGAVTHSDRVTAGAGTYVFEVKGALNSADDLHDFSLAIGDQISFAIAPDVASCLDGWPPTNPLIRLATAGAAPGAACTSSSECARGQCVDGVCCNSACGGGVASDCQACSVAAGGLLDGICTLHASTSVCRAAADLCDAAETCSGISPTCPADQPAPAGQSCRAPTGACDIAATCDGSSTACPGNAFSTAGTRCADPPTPCDNASVCSGTSASCPAATAIPQCSFAELATPAGPDSGALQLTGTSMSNVGAVSIEFLEGISSAGDTTVVMTGSGSAPPTGYRIVGVGGSPMYYNFDTTAARNPPGDIEICIHYDQTQVTGSEASLVFYHDVSTPPAPPVWRDITTSLNTTANIICGRTTSLSPFVIAEPIDTTPPVFAGVPGTIVAPSTTTAGASVSYPQPTATDDLGGQVTVSCAPAPGSTFAPGYTNVTCTAADGWGNAATTSFVVWVQYQAPANGAFFRDPINSDGSSIFKRGSTIPVKFKLQGASAGITNLAARLAVAKASSNVTGSDVEGTSTGAANTGDTFRYDDTAGQYIFNLSTKAMTTGTWVLRADLGDKVDHVVHVSLR